MNDTKQWYASKAIWGAILMILALVAQAFGYSIGAEDQATLVDTFSGIAGSAGAVLAIVGRVKASKKIGP